MYHNNAVGDYLGERADIIDTYYWVTMIYVHTYTWELYVREGATGGVRGGKGRVNQSGDLESGTYHKYVRYVLYMDVCTCTQ